MLRYATAPITANNKNASANPAAILRPNVHMSSLLRDAVVAGASLNCFSNERNTDDRTNHIRRAHHMLNVRASHVLCLSRIKLGQGNPDVTFEVTKHQGEGTLGSAQGEPTRSLCFRVVAKKHRQTVHGNEGTPDTR